LADGYTFLNPAIAILSAL